jgi:tetratricopeptide (TPR) repeat protein
MSSTFTRQTWLSIALIVASTLATFGRLCVYDFTSWDDNATVWENPHLLPPTASSLWQLWTTERIKAHILVPVTWTTWWLLAVGCARPAFGKFVLDPHVYHTANVLLHVMTSVLVFLLLRRLLRARSDWPACAGALLFALHPVQVETVAWISGTKDLLAGLFMVIAMLHYAHYATSVSPRARTLHYVLTVVASIAAMLSKPSAVALPLIIAAIDGLLLRRRTVEILRGVLPLLMFTAPCLLWSKAAQTGQGLPTLVSVPWRPLVALDALAFYLAKLVWPFRLAIDYGRYPKHVIESGQAWFTWIAPVLLVAIVWLLRRRLPELVTGAGIFVAALLPVLGLVPFDFQQYSTVADHYLYVAMIGTGLAAAAALMRDRTPIASTIIGLTLVALAIRSFDQARHWRNSFTLFEHAVAINDRSWLANNNLAEAWIQNKQYDLAERYARRALEVSPQNAAAHMNLGVALLKQRDLPGATHEFATAVRLQPTDVEAHINLAMAYAQADRLDEAIRHYQLALALDPHNPVAQQWLKLALEYRQDLLRRGRATTAPTTLPTPLPSPVDRPAPN